MLFRALLCLCLCGWVPAVVATEPSPLADLQRMADAARELNYTGSFTYEHRNAMESFRVYHWVENDQSHRRLEYLNSPRGAALDRAVPRDCRSLGYRLLQSSDKDLKRLEQYYRLSYRGEDWVAGRQARLIEVRPKDQWRYGYLLGLDRESGLLLRAILIDDQQRVLERFQFVDLTLASEPEAVLARLDGSARNAEIRECSPSQTDAPRRWSLSWQPPGFVFSGQRRLDDNIDMLMYTDGLASFSVFLQPVSGDLRIEGRAQRGATSAYMGQLTVGERRYRVTVVGEIPGAVAEQLARGINVLPRGQGALDSAP